MSGSVQPCSHGEKSERTQASRASSSQQPILLSRRTEGLGSADGGRAGGHVRAVLRSPGQPLDAVTRTAAERTLGPLEFNFGSVRIHSDAAAANSARSLGARAYTAGNHIVFGAGRFQPQTVLGNELLLHELGHVMQHQRRGGGEPAISKRQPLVLSDPSSPEERQATALAKGQFLSIGSSRQPDGALVIWRDLDPDLTAALDDSDQSDDEENRQRIFGPNGVPSLATLRGAALPAEGPAAPAPAHDPSEWRLRDKALPPAAQRETGYVAHERTKKADRFDGIEESLNPDPDSNAGELKGALKLQRPGGVRQVIERSEAKVTDPTGTTVVERAADTAKQFSGNRETRKVRQQELADGSRVVDGEAESQEGQSSKHILVRTTNKQAETTVETVTQFDGKKDSKSGVSLDGRFRESETVDGTNFSKSTTNTVYKDPNGNRVGSETVERTVKTTGRSEVQLENVGYKYAALDLKRREKFKGTRQENSRRDTTYKSGATQQEDSSTTTRELSSRAQVTTVETQRRLRNGKELKTNTRTSFLTSTTTRKKTSTQSPGALAQESTDTERRSTDKTWTLAAKAKDFSSAKPGSQLPNTLVRPATQVAKLEDIGLVKTQNLYTDQNGNIVKPDTQGTDKAEYEKAAKEGRDATYIERIHVDGTHVTAGDQAELSDGGAGVSGQKTVQHGILDSFLRKDRRNFGWLAVEQVVTNSVLVGSETTTKAGLRGQGDVAGAVASYGYMRGLIARSSVKQTFRIGPASLSLELDQSSLAGFEGSASGEAGWGKNAGYGLSANVSAFAGTRATVGFTLGVAIGDVSIGTGGVHVRGSLGVGFTLKFDARYHNSQFIFAGSVAASADAGVGADAELRLNPAAIPYALGKLGGQLVLSALGQERIKQGQAAVSSAYHHDDNARAVIESGKYKQQTLEQRIGLVRTLLHGWVNKPEQQAVLTVLEDAAGRSELAAIVSAIGGFRFRLSLDGPEKRRYLQLIGQ